MKSAKKISLSSCKRSSFRGCASRSFLMVLAVLLSANLTATSAEYVEITQKKSKKTLSVEILSFDGSEITFVTRHGKKYTIDSNLLTEDSLKALKSKAKVKSTAQQELYSKVNGCLGQPLFTGDKGLWEQPAGMGPDHFKKLHPEKVLPNTLEETIEMDAELISESLSSALGEPVKQYYGEKEDRRKVKRWNLESHAFLLSEVEGEYTSLLVVSKKMRTWKAKSHL